MQEVSLLTRESTIKDLVDRVNELVSVINNSVSPAMCLKRIQPTEVYKFTQNKISADGTMFTIPITGVYKVVFTGTGKVQCVAKTEFNDRILDTKAQVIVNSSYEMPETLLADGDVLQLYATPSNANNSIQVKVILQSSFLDLITSTISICDAVSDTIETIQNTEKDYADNLNTMHEEIENIKKSITERYDDFDNCKTDPNTGITYETVQDRLSALTGVLQGMIKQIEQKAQRMIEQCEDVIEQGKVEIVDYINKSTGNLNNLHMNYAGVKNLVEALNKVPEFTGIDISYYIDPDEFTFEHSVNKTLSADGETATITSTVHLNLNSQNTQIFENKNMVTLDGSVSSDHSFSASVYSNGQNNISYTDYFGVIYNLYNNTISLETQTAMDWCDVNLNYFFENGFGTIVQIDSNRYLIGVVCAHGSDVIFTSTSSGKFTGFGPWGSHNYDVVFPDEIMKYSTPYTNPCKFVIGTTSEGNTAYDCDFICNGKNDAEVINAAIVASHYITLDSQIKISTDVELDKEFAGGEIVLRAGTYNLSEPIELKYGHITLRGENGARLVRDSDATNAQLPYLIKISPELNTQNPETTAEDDTEIVQNVKVDSLVLDNTGVDTSNTNNIVSGIYIIGNPSQPTIDDTYDFVDWIVSQYNFTTPQPLNSGIFNCEIIGGHYGIYCGSSRGLKIHKTIINSSSLNGIMLDAFYEYLESEYNYTDTGNVKNYYEIFPSKCDIKSCEIHNAANGIVAISELTTVEDCLFKTISGNGIDCTGIVWNIRKNTFDSIGQNGIFHEYSTTVNRHTHQHISKGFHNVYGTLKDVQISDNNFYWMRYVQTSSNWLRSNCIKLVGKTPNETYKTPTVEGINISNNRHLQGNGFSDTAMIMVSYGGNIAITGNVTTHNGCGIAIIGDTVSDWTGHPNVEISGNQVNYGYVGLYLEDTRYTNVTGNSFINPIYHGVYLKGACGCNISSNTSGRTPGAWSSDSDNKDKFVSAVYCDGETHPCNDNLININTFLNLGIVSKGTVSNTVSGNKIITT